MCGKCTIQMAFKKPNTKEKKCLIKFLINYFFFFFFLISSGACGSFWVRDRTRAMAVTRATAVTTPNPYLLSHQGTPNYMLKL